MQSQMQLEIPGLGDFTKIAEAMNKKDEALLASCSGCKDFTKRLASIGGTQCLPGRMWSSLHVCGRTTAVSVLCLKPDVNPGSGAVPFAACLCGGKRGAEHLKPDAEKDPSC